MEEEEDVEEFGGEGGDGAGGECIESHPERK